MENIINEMNEALEKVAKAHQRAMRNKAFDDIIDIYEGKYPTYDDYIRKAMNDQEPQEPYTQYRVHVFDKDSFDYLRGKRK